MRFERYLVLACVFTLLSSALFAQGLETTASKDDWEEINFEFNSHILTDGYPSLLRLAELLNKKVDHKVKVEGHADFIGSDRYNVRLGQRRADTVKAFLLKYGARDNQITTATAGERQPKVQVRTKEGRFMNRRVMLTVTDAQGRIVSAGGVGDAIEALQKSLQGLADAQKKCCDDILKRLDRLDEIADMLKKLAGENDNLKKELADLRKAQSDLDAYVRGVPKPLTREETTNIVDTRTAEQIERARMPRFSILGMNAGIDQEGELTFTGRGRFFAPFKDQFAVQMQGEYMYFRDRREGQFDFGLVNRFATRGQAGLFGSFKHVNLVRRVTRDPFAGITLSTPNTNLQFDIGQPNGSGLLGQASATLDYLFSRGRLGIFGAKGFMNSGAIESVALSRNVFLEAYLKTIDQIGLSATVGLVGDVYAEGNFGYLKSNGNADRPGGTLRFVFPFSDRLAFTLEGGMNETLVSRSNNGRVVAGLQFGNFQRPQDYLDGVKGVQTPVPADIPRVRYELLTRRVRSGGNDSPVCVAGSDQLGVTAGPVTLNGADSFDPDGDPITFQWSQVSGPSVSISGMNTAIASFTAAQGQTYSFRLLVRDERGAQCIARTTVTTATPPPVQVLRFQANPDTIQAGESSNLDWQVLNAESVSITELGNVQSAGTREVRPTRTTTYRLTARGPGGEATATATVTVVQQQEPTIVACQVSPTNIIAGETATIFFSTLGAQTVTIDPGIGAVDARSGSRTVSPAQTTTYTLTARNQTGAATCNVTVQVTPGTVPRVVNFNANPMTITAGQSSTLTFAVENADTVTISGLGSVEANGTRSVSPTQTTTYTLTATNRAGSTTATATITVTQPPVTPPPTQGPPPSLTACAAQPATSARPGDPVRLTYQSLNAGTVTISGVTGTVPLVGPVTVNPQQTTTYTVTATGTDNRTATCTITVTVTPPPATPPPTAIVSGPSTLETIYRQLTLDGSQSVNPAGGALTYIWEPLSTGSAVLDQGQAQTRVQLGGLFGDYIFKLTVRNAAGQTDSTTVTVRFRSTRVP